MGRNKIPYGPSGYLFLANMKLNQMLVFASVFLNARVSVTLS